MNALFFINGLLGLILGQSVWYHFCWGIRHSNSKFFTHLLTLAKFGLILKNLIMADITKNCLWELLLIIGIG